MAFSATVTNTLGRTMQDAYIRIEIARTTRTELCILLEVWEDEAARKDASKPPFSLKPITLKADPDLQAANPYDYAYKLLEHSALFPDAVWDI